MTKAQDGSESRLLQELISRHVALWGDRTALVDVDLRLSYEELEKLILSLSLTLSKEGVGEGDRVVLRLPNSAEYVVAFFAVLHRRAIAVPLDANAGEHRTRLVVEDATPKLVLHSRGSADAEVTPLPSLWLAIDRRTKKISCRSEIKKPSTSAKEIEGGAGILLYSSGSTGDPKGAMLTEDQLLGIARMLSQKAGMEELHRELVLGPLTHSGAFQRVNATLWRGGCVVLYPGPLSVPGLLSMVKAHGINGFFASPPLLRVLLGTSPSRLGTSLATLRSIETASAPLSKQELSSLVELLAGVEILYQYGLTECSRALILDVVKDPEKLHTVGKATPGIEVGILSDDGRLLPAEEEGEILLKGPQKTQRYWNRPDLTEERFFGSWLRTGDMGKLDSDGFLTLLGRVDDRINCGGFSFYPPEVEAVLLKFPGVEEAIVAGVPDPKGFLHEVPWAFIVPEDPDSFSSRELMLAARKKLPSHMVPRKVVLVSSTEVSSTGKVNRRLLVDRHGPRESGGECLA